MRREVALARLFLLALVHGDDVAFTRKVLRPLVVKQGLAGLALDRFALEKDRRHQVHLLRMSNQNLMGAVMRLPHNLRDLNVDAPCRLVGVVLRIAVVAPEEDLMVGLAEDLRAKRRHAVLRDDGARHLRRPLEVVGSTRCDVVAENLLSNAPAHEHRKLVLHFGERVQRLIVVRD